MAEYSTLLGEVLPDVAGCSEPLAVRTIRDVVIEMCSRAKLIKRPIEDQAVLLGEPRVTIVPEAGFRLEHLQNVQLDKKEVHHASQDDLDLAWRDFSYLLPFQMDWHHDDCGGTSETWRTFHQQRPRAYYIEKSDAADVIRLVGIPDSPFTDLAYTKIVVPTRSSTGVDEWLLERYYMTIKHGAVGKLKAMGKQAWTDNAGAAYHLSEFNTWLTNPKRDAATDFNRDDESVGRVESCY